MINADSILHALESHVFRTVLASHGEKTARACAGALFECLCLNFRYRQMYVPTTDWKAILARYESIWRDFNGHNHIDLAAKYRISMQRIYKIVAYMRANHIRQRQSDLFPMLDESEDKRPLTLIVLEDYLPTEFARAGLSETEAKTLAQSVQDKLCNDYPGVQVSAFDTVYRARHNGGNEDLFAEAS